MKKQYIYPAVTVSRITLTPVMTVTSMGVYDETTDNPWVREEEQLPELPSCGGQEEW